MEIRPANSRITHGLQYPGDKIGFQLSVSATAFAENLFVDPWLVRESGGGMDAPQELPTGSVKAFFSSLFNESLNGSKICFGQCQRTTPRTK